MNNPTVYDVLVVYTDGVATSASSTRTQSTHPFSLSSKFASYNECYAYFFKICRELNLKVAFTTSGDLAQDGKFKSHWVLERNKWIKKNKSCYAPLIFDKFSPINAAQKKHHTALFANIGIKPFNSHAIVSLFSDKQETYNKLSKFTIPTVTLKTGSDLSVENAVKELEQLIKLHPKNEDFSNRIVIKDRFGAGGNNIYRTDNKGRRTYIRKTMNNNKEIAFVLQPFTYFDNGNAFEDRPGFVDIRIIYLGTKIIQTYIRTAAKNDFRCNLHQGGNVEYINSRDLPPKIKKMATQIIKVIKDKSSFFALDFILSNKGNVYLMEGNSHPGVIWSTTSKNDEKYTKKLIRKVVRELQSRVQEKKSENFAEKVLYSQLQLTENIPLVA